MLFSPDTKDLLELFERHEVRYVLVGGYAVNYYGYIRATQDIDLLVYPSRDNAERVMAALTAFGFGSAGIPQAVFETPGSAIHLGAEPNRIDLLTRLKGVENDAIFREAERAEIDGASIPVIAREHLIEAKQCSDRARDQADAEELLSRS